MKMAKRQMIDRTMLICEAIADSCGEIGILAEEMREAFDNTPESLQNSGVGEARGVAADALECITEPYVDDSVKGIEIKFNQPSLRKRPSRSDRCSYAVFVLQVVVDKLEEVIEDETTPEDTKRDAEGLRDEVQNVIDEAEAVEFPGMFR
jgi:hypothetical protein